MGASGFWWGWGEGGGEMAFEIRGDRDEKGPKHGLCRGMAFPIV